MREPPIQQSLTQMAFQKPHNNRSIFFSPVTNDALTAFLYTFRWASPAWSLNNTGRLREFWRPPAGAHLVILHEWAEA